MRYPHAPVWGPEISDVRRRVTSRSGVLARVAAVALGASALGACSGDTMRFADPFGNPFGRGEPTMTGSLASEGAPTLAVESAPLAAPGGFTSASSPMSIGASPGASMLGAAPSISAPTTVRSAGGGSGRPGWTALGGTPIVVRDGETMATIASRYNVPADAIQTVNGLTSPSDVRAGRAIVIPVYDAGGGGVASAPQPQLEPQRQTPSAQASAANPTQTGSLASTPLPPRRPASASAPARLADPAATAALPAAAPAAQSAAPAARVASLPDASTSLDFRWPARGRVISGFGTAGNEGINIALPEGTPVRAAEGGTVAYAGEELRGYGKLVLIRHDDGFVSAYAHNSVLQVGQGDQVRRGQVIANSGRSGNVTSPQLHFEIRKGSDPVDPMPYLTN